MKTFSVRSSTAASLQYRLEGASRGRGAGSLTTALLLALAAQGPVQAQVQAQERGGTLEEVIVTAQKREQRLEDVPALINPLTDASLQAASVTKFEDVGRMVPGLEVSATATGQGATVKMRGIGGDSSHSVTLKDSVGYFYNEIPLINTGASGGSIFDIDFFDIDRLEVLKGPQSTLYGTAVSTGAFSLYTTRPKLNQFSGKVSINIGDHNRQEYRGAINVPLGDQLAVRLTAYDTTNKSQIRNVVDDSRLQTDTWGGRLQILYKPTDNLDLLLTHERRGLHAGGGAGGWPEYERVSYPASYVATAAGLGINLLTPDPFGRKMQVKNPTTGNVLRSLTSLHANWTLNDQWSLTSVSGFQTEQYYRYGNDVAGGGDSTPGLFDTLGNYGKEKTNYFTQEVRVNFKGEKLTSTLGLYYEHTTTPQNRIDLNFVGFPIVQDLGTGSGDAKSIFTNNSFRFTEQWELVFGGRYTTSRSSSQTGAFFNAGGYCTSNCGAVDFAPLPVNTIKPSAWGGTLKGIYHLSQDVSLYAGVDRGFKLGGNNGYSAPPFGTETTVNYEVGLKGDFLDRTLRLSTSAYHQTYTNYQAFSQANNPATGLFSFFVTNAAKVVVKGVETSVDWLPTRHISLGAGLALNDARFIHYLGAQCNAVQQANGGCPTGLQDLSNVRLNNAPLWSGNVDAQYNGEVGSTGMTWYVRGEYSYRSQSHGTVDSDPRAIIPAYGVMNASASLASGNDTWETILWVKNLTNKDYYTGFYADGTGYPGLLAFIGFERSVGITLNYNFK